MMTITGDTKLNTSPKPAIYTEVRLRVDGPYSQVEQFRQWFKDEFKTWSKPFRCYVDGRARREGGVLWVYIDMKASAHGVICHLAELCKRHFPGVYIDGTAHECGSWQFTTVAVREGLEHLRQCCQPERCETRSSHQALAATLFSGEPAMMRQSEYLTQEIRESSGGVRK
jgi:hypothetical protein